MLLGLDIWLYYVLKQKPSEIFASENAAACAWSVRKERFGLAYGECGCDFFFLIYLFNFFIFGCVGSSLLRAGFL